MVVATDAVRHQRVTEEDVALGDRLRVIRKSKGVTHKALAAYLGVNARQMHKYEHGLNRISALRLNAISLFLNTPIEDFLVDFRAGATVTQNRHSRENLEMAEMFDQLPASTRRAVLTLTREIFARRKM